MTARIDREKARRCCVTILLLAASQIATAQEDVYVDAGRGPVRVHVPAAYSDGVPAPLVIELHGRWSSGEQVENYLQLTPVADQRGFLLALPDGGADDRGFHFWNATDACHGEPDVDDSGYLRDLIGVITGQFTVDSRRVLVFGHSNGGCMAHRVGCDHADLVAAIGSLSGVTWDDPAQCVPAAPVHALEIHGTADEVWPYEGGCTEPDVCFPSAEETAQTWADLNHCTEFAVMPGYDLTLDVPGRETRIKRYSACEHGGSSELWTMMNAPHHPGLTPSFNDIVIDYLLSHPKPSDIPCDDVATLRAQCSQSGKLVINLRLTDSIHDGKTVDITVDDDTFVAPVLASRAQLVRVGQSPGVHVVRMVEPAGCALAAQAICGP